MELGTGIFLSAIFLGTVALFIATKDRWNWKKIVFWPLGISVAVAVIGGAGSYFYSQYEDRPRNLIELWGVSFNDTKADVRFKKGEPTYEVEDEGSWIYSQDETTNKHYALVFRDDRLYSILYFGPMYDAPSFPGFDLYGTIEDLESRLGAPSHVSKSKDDLRRYYSFDQYNIVAGFKQGALSVVGIYNPAHGPIRFLEESEVETNSK